MLSERESEIVEPKYTQVMNNLQFVVGDSDVWWGGHILTHGLCFPQTDGESEVVVGLVKATHKLLKFLS